MSDNMKELSPPIGHPHIAVIGAGYWGKNLVRNFFELGSLKIICDLDDNIRYQMIKNYPDLRVEDNFEAVMNDPDIQAVVIATPPATHFELARNAILSGKHVFVEKPLSLSYDDGRNLVDLAQKNGKIIFVGHILQYHTAVIKLKDMINSGTLGRLEYIYSHRLSFGKIRREENILWSFAPHDISVILSLVGEEPFYVDSVGSNFLHPRIADVTMTNLKFPSGIGANIFVSWLNPFKEQRLVVIGSQGMIVFNDMEVLEKKLMLFPHTINWRDGIPVPEKAEGIAIDISDAWEEPMKSECKAFLSSIQTGLKPVTSGEEGLRVLNILQLSQRSMELKENAPRPLREIKEVVYFAHESAIIDEGAQIGAGTKIWHFSHVMKDAKIGKSCNIGQNVVIGAGVVIGNRVKIQNNVSVYEGVTLEEDVFCGPSMVFTNVYNPRAAIPRMKELRPTLIRKGATMGANSTIVCGNTVGRYAFVGAGAVVKKDVPDYAMIAGNPGSIKGWMCQCGNRISFHGQSGKCIECHKEYLMNHGKDHVEEVSIKTI